MIIQKINDKTGVRIGVSAAASWAWGTSLFLGMEIAQTRGVTAFMIWAVANFMTLALFGFLVNRGIINKRVFDNSLIKAVAIVIQMFCLVIQLNIINNTLINWIPNPVASYAVTTAVGLAFSVAVFKKGLPTSIKLDCGKWAIAMGACVAIIIIGFACGQSIIQFPQSGYDDVMWGLWSAAILISGPIGDVQHWQRAINDRSGKAYYKGAAFFAVYMACIFGMANFEFNGIMNGFLLIACLMVTVSTINSIAVAMHEVGSGGGDKKLGLIITAAICFLWGLFIEIGIADLWSNFGIVRVCLAIVIVVSSLVVTSVVRSVRNATAEAID